MPPPVAVSRPASPPRPTSESASKPPRPERIEPLDYLRGVLAFSVLLYHFVVWSGLTLPELVHGVVYRTGVYAVLMFYVISGTSFGYVYRRMSLDAGSLGSFWIKRYFRLAPLYWFALAAGLALLAALSGELPSVRDVLLNVSLTFGVVDPAAYLVTGGWSIGNEMAYYVFFPFALLATRRSGPWFALVLAGSVLLGAAYAFSWLTPAEPLDEQWATYIEPGSHLFYFVAGVALSSLLVAGRRLTAGQAALATAACILVYLALAAVDGRADNVVAVTGWRWAAYSAVCIALVGVVALTPGQLPGAAHAAFSWLGKVSYSVYLLHPVVWLYTQAGLQWTDSEIPTVIVALPLSLVAADLAYRLVEAPLITRGRGVADRYARWVEGRRGGTSDAPPSQW